MKVVAISDTHLQFDYKNMPKGDILVHAGDLLNSGSLRDWLRGFQELKELKKMYEYVVYVSGNHDHYVEDNEFRVKGELLSEGIHLLIDEEICIQGRRIYGSPWTPRFGPWAYMKSRGESLSKVWQNIPSGLDLLILHGPPLGILDTVPSGESVGCWDLKHKLHTMDQPPKNIVWGHIHHEGNKSVRHLISLDPFSAVNCYNVAICSEQYVPVSTGTLLEI